MITNGEKWYYLALLLGVTSKNNSDKYCINYLHLFRTDYKLKLLENMCKNHLRNLIIYWSVIKITNLQKYYSSSMQIQNLSLKKYKHVEIIQKSLSQQK